MTRTRRPRQKGNVLVESALVLFVFIIVLIGIVDFGQILYVHQALVERVRNVTRNAVVSALTDAQIRNMIVYGQTSARTTDSGTPLPGYLGLRPEHVNVQILDRTYNEHRLVVEVRGTPVAIISPLIVGTGQIIPLRVAIPLEEP